jgi:serine protease AprX
MSNVNAAIDWALAGKATYGIDALNLSLGGSLRSDGLDTTSVLLNKATASGLAVFVAAGNAGPAARTIGVPGAARWVTTVGAMADTTAGGLGVAPYSSRGPTADNRVKPDVVAPGTAITAARSGTGNGYTTLSGTSMATRSRSASASWPSSSTPPSSRRAPPARPPPSATAPTASSTRTCATR